MMSRFVSLSERGVSSSSVSDVADNTEGVTTHFEAGWAHVVYSEVLAVQTAMRRNSRWELSQSGSSVGGGGGGSMTMTGPLVQEHPLMAGFTTLKAYLAQSLAASQTHHRPTLSALTVITPFLDVIRSGSTTGSQSAFLFFLFFFLSFFHFPRHIPLETLHVLSFCAVHAPCHSNLPPSLVMVSPLQVLLLGLRCLLLKSSWSTISSGVCQMSPRP